MPMHPEVERPQTSQRQIAVERAGDGARGVLKEFQLLEVLAARSGQRAPDEVAVAADVLGGAVDDDGRSQLEGVLQARGGEGVVDGQRQSVTPRDLRYPSDV